jgi:thiamine biosynthesis lipoprotein
VTRVRHRRATQLMGMPISLAVGAPVSGEAVDAAWAEALAELRWVDLVFSRWRADSAVSRLARGELTVADCPREVAEVLHLGERATEESDGAFTMLLPDPQDPGGVRRLDPTGVVKGWAVERAAQRLAHLRDFCLSAGGDMVCRCEPGAAPWQIGIENPHDAARIVAILPVTTGAVATSGTAHRGTHLLDGRTGRPADELSSVTVTAASLTVADIDATSACALGPDAEAWLRSRLAQGRLAHAVVVGRDGSSRLVA